MGKAKRRDLGVEDEAVSISDAALRCHIDQSCPRLGSAFLQSKPRIWH